MRRTDHNGFFAWQSIDNDVIKRAQNTAKYEEYDDEWNLHMFDLTRYYYK
jgi:hypothetical protein